VTNEASSGDASVVANAEREARAPRAAGIAGLVFAALFVFSVTLLGNHPAPGSSAAEIASWYTRESPTIALVGLYLVPFAGIAFLWFVAVIRDVVGDREDRFLATVFLGSGLLFVAMLFAAAASAGALIALIRFQGAPAPSPDSVDLARSLAYAFMYVFGVRVAAVFVLVSSTIGRRTGTMPRWLAYAGVAVALVLLFTVSYFQFTVLLFPFWVSTVSIVILIANRARPHRDPPPKERSAQQASGD
jgi:hypothetical protein